MVKINIKDLIILIFIYICLIFGAVLLGYLIASIIVYYERGIFEFDWKEVLPSALKKGIAGGTVLGIGIWVKAKLEERRSKKAP